MPSASSRNFSPPPLADVLALAVVLTLSLRSLLNLAIERPCLALRGAAGISVALAGDVGGGVPEMDPATDAAARVAAAVVIPGMAVVAAVVAGVGVAESIRMGCALVDPGSMMDTSSRD
jgi:hypothetical protein